MRRRGKALQDERERWFRLHPMCARCDLRLARELDHIVALVNGGSDTRDNKQGLCKPCHKIKTAQDLGHRQPQKVNEDGYPEDER